VRRSTFDQSVLQTLVESAIGAGVDIAMKAGLNHGLIDKRDYTVIETLFPTMPSIRRIMAWWRKSSRYGIVHQARYLLRMHDNKRRNSSESSCCARSG
jgi:hypothetical protein